MNCKERVKIKLTDGDTTELAECNDLFSMFQERILSLEDSFGVLFPALESMLAVEDSISVNRNTEDLLQCIFEEQSHPHNYFCLLTQIIRKIGSKEEKEMSDNMERSYDRYFLGSCFPRPQPADYSGDCFLAEFKIATDKKESILRYVQDFKQQIERCFSIPPGKMLLSYTGQGSLVIAFQIPLAYIYSLVFTPLHANMVTSLKDENICFLKFEEHVMWLERWNVFQDKDVKFGKTIFRGKCNRIRKGKLKGVPCMTLEYSNKANDLSSEVGFVKYLENCLNYCHKNLATVKGVYYPKRKSMLYPVLIAEKCKSLKKMVAKIQVKEVDQVSFLLDIASYISNFESGDESVSIKIDPSTVFTSEQSGHLVPKMYPLYSHSFIVRESLNKPLSLSVEDLMWMESITKYLHFGQVSSKQLPEHHLMKKMFEQKWLSDDDRFRPANFKVLCDDLQQLLGK